MAFSNLPSNTGSILKPVAARTGHIAPVDRLKGEGYKQVREFWMQRKASGFPTVKFILRNPQLSIRAANAFAHLPRLQVHLSQNRSGLLLRKYLTRICFSRCVRLNSIGVNLLEIPKPPRRCDEGSRKQTFRRYTRRAIKAGVTWRCLDDLSEQYILIDSLDKALAGKSRYQQVNSDHSYLVGSGPWTVAFGPDGAPLLIAVTPYDGEWALLQVFLTLGDGPLYSDARYMLVTVIADRLAALGVRYLFDGRSPQDMPIGLWQFQQMLGFQIAVLRVRDRP